MEYLSSLGSEVVNYTLGIETTQPKPDPISILAVVALTKFKETGTRISFSGHKVTTQQPSDYQFIFNWQWAARTINGDSREDLRIIKQSIETVARWYKPHLEDNELSKSVKIFLGYVKEGLKEGLSSRTYSSISVVTNDALGSWSKLIDEVQRVEITSFKNDSFIEKKIKGLWLASEIALLNDYLLNMPKNSLIIEDFEGLLEKKSERLLKIYYPG